MNREQFFGKLGTLDEERLKKALWNLYWRGSANLREKIEAELEPGAGVRAQSLADQMVDPQTVLSAVREFVALARSGAYMAGDRRVSPKERTRWRFHLPAPGERGERVAQRGLHRRLGGVGADGGSRVRDARV